MLEHGWEWDKLRGCWVLRDERGNILMVREGKAPTFFQRIMRLILGVGR